jgi:hypothetical protein
MAEAEVLIMRMATGSMHPTIAVDDLLIARPRGARLPRPGEIWVLPPHDALRERHAHRVARAFRLEGADWIVARGDANASEDPPLRADAALARVVAVGRELGRQPSRTALALARPAALWLLSGNAARLDARLLRIYSALGRRSGWTGRLSRRAVIALFLAHEELLCGARARALMEIAFAARR